MDELDQRLLWKVKKLNMGIESLMNCMFEDMGLTGSQGAVLMFILEHPGSTICSTRIHRVFGVARPTVSGLLKKLRKKEYIEFQTCEQDDRQKMIQATPLAEELKQVMDLRMQDMEHHILEDLTPQEEQAMEGYFSRMDRSLKMYRMNYGK